MRSVLRQRSHRSLTWVLLALFVSLSALVSACASPAGVSGSAPTAQKPLISADAYGSPITIPAKAPQRIISLTPGDSEMLAAVGATAHVIGVDALTNYPAAMAAKPKVTDNLDNPNIEQIIALNPDLVLSWNTFTQQAVKALRRANINVVSLPAEDLAGTLTEIRLVGQLTHTSPTAETVVKSLQQRIDAVKQKVAQAPRPSVYVEVSYGPIYAAGGGSFENEVAQDAGGSNIFASNTGSSGYPEVSAESIIAASPQVIILTDGSEFGDTVTSVYSRAGWSGIAAVKAHHVYLIDPDIISRPGPRLVDALEQIAKLLHPDLFA